MPIELRGYHKKVKLYMSVGHKVAQVSSNESRSGTPAAKRQLAWTMIVFLLGCGRETSNR